MIAVLLFAESLPTTLRGPSGEFTGAFTGDAFRAFLDSQGVQAYRSSSLAGGAWSAMLLQDAPAVAPSWTALNSDGSVAMSVSFAALPAVKVTPWYLDPRFYAGVAAGAVAKSSVD